MFASASGTVFVNDDVKPFAGKRVHGGESTDTMPSVVPFVVEGSAVTDGTADTPQRPPTVRTASSNSTLRGSAYSSQHDAMPSTSVVSSADTLPIRRAPLIG